MMLKLIKKHLKNEKGLTLIELLVVVVILGIISSIAVVSIGNIVGETKDKAKVTEAVQIINAAKLKHASDGTYPANGWASTANSNDLSEYISGVKDNIWTVTWTKAEGYKIEGHESASKIDSSYLVTTKVKESELSNYLD